MRCLITGVAGFIGSHLAERLLADGHEVVGLDTFTPFYAREIKERNLENARSWHTFTLYEVDLLKAHLEPLLAGVGWVFHQAAQAGVRTSWDDIESYISANVLATRRLLDAVTKVGQISRFIYASSSSVYGQANALPLTEETLPRPFSPYGVTKLAAEHLCMAYQSNFSVPAVALRYFTVYGPRQRPDMAFYRFCEAILKRQPVPLYGDGCQTRDFTYVSDIVEANLSAATAEGVIGRALNIAGGAHVSLNQALALLQEIGGRTAIIHPGQKHYGDVQDTRADTHLAEQLLGYRPGVTLMEGLTRQFEYMLSIHAIHA